MKITRKQLRKLIIEAMWSPIGAQSAAIRDSDVSNDHLEKILTLSKDNPKQAVGLFDAITDYDPESPLSTGSSLEDIARFDREMIIANAINAWQGYYNDLADDEKDAFDILINPNTNPTLVLEEEEDHPDYGWPSGFPEDSIPQTHPDRYYLNSIKTNPRHQLRNAVNKIRPRPNAGDGIDSDQDAIHWLVDRASGMDRMTAAMEDDLWEERSKVEQAMIIWLMHKLPNMEVETLQ